MEEVALRGHGRSSLVPKQVIEKMEAGSSQMCIGAGKRAMGIG